MSNITPKESVQIRQESARYLWEVRREKGHTPRWLSAKTGVNYHTLVEIENGTTTPTFDQLAAIANALGVPPAELMEQIKDKITPITKERRDES